MLNKMIYFFGIIFFIYAPFNFGSVYSQDGRISLSPVLNIYLSTSFLSQQENESISSKSNKRFNDFLENLEAAKIKYKTTTLPWVRLIREVKLKDNAIIYGITRLEERENDFHWLLSLTPEEDTWVQLYGVNDPKNINLTKEDILDKKHTALCEIGTAECTILKQFGFGDDQIISNPSSTNQAQLELMVLRGRADYVLGFESDVKDNLKALGLEEDAVIPVQKVMELEIYLAAPNSLQPELLAQVKNALKSKLPTLSVLANKFPPFIDEDENGNPTGSMIPMVRAFLDSKNVDYSLRIVPWERAYQEVTTRENTLIFALNRTPEREDSFHWILPLTTQKYYLFGRNDPDYTALNKEQILNGKYKAICEDKTSQCDELKVFGFDPDNVIQINAFSPSVVSRLVVNKRADFLIESIDSMEGNLKFLKLPLNSLVPIVPTETITDYLAASKNIDPRIIKYLMDEPKPD